MVLAVGERGNKIRKDNSPKKIDQLADRLKMEMMPD
jgi:hypothetical protein